MTESESKRALAAAVEAAQAAGALMYRHLHHPKIINEEHAHDIKLELDVRCQKLIEKQLHRALPGAALLGEEGVSGDPGALSRWVVDPIDGTVNFAYGIPHACVSIALQEQALGDEAGAGAYPDGFVTTVGVIFDPFTNELWTARRGGPAHLNGRRIAVSKRAKLAEAILALGFSKSKSVLQETLPQFARLVHRVRKIRIMGSAALSLAYVAGGRMEAYLENGVRLWDIAAGGLLVECAGGKFRWKKVPGEQRYWMLAENGRTGAAVLRATHD
jgi:myo-inositol-1(or 4)-monophosphatase